MKYLGLHNKLKGVVHQERLPTGPLEEEEVSLFLLLFAVVPDTGKSARGKTSLLWCEQ
jgi:hypothetical protein